MRFLRAAAVAVVLVAVVLAGLVLLGAGDEVPGTARPMDKRSLLASCEFEGLDLDSVTYGPMVLDHTGGLLLLATTARGTVLNCSTFGLVGTNGPYGPRDLPQGVEFCEYAVYSVPWKSGFTGSGCAASDVARIEVVLPGGQVIDVVPVNGLFAYAAPGDFEDGVVLRAYDEAGTLLQES